MTTMFLHPGKRLGSNYELETIVGTGQFGQVWRARKLNPPSDAPVALKVPLDPHRGEEVLMADGKYMLDLPRHPGVVAVNWQGRIGTMWVLEMEFVNGCPLSQLMGDEVQWSKVTFDEIIRWFTGVAEALAFLHQHDIAHGDIKPDNLLFDEASGQLKITDFGTSRRLTDNLIRTFRHAGAWAYQAPEIQQANQRGAVSDLFSVGAVLYQVTTGRLPRASIHELLTSAPITRPRQFNPAIPEELDTLIMDLLVDDPQRRLPTAAALRTRLLALMPERHTEQVPTLHPLTAGSGYLDRAASLLAEGRKEEAREAASKATLHSTGLVPALELYARLSDELGYSEDAINAFKRLLSLDSTPDETRRSAEVQLADLLLKLHRYEEAESYVEAAIETEPVPRSMLFKAAVVLGACTKLDRSLILLDRLLVQDARDAAALEKKVLVLWLMHRYQEAAQTAREVLTLMPDSEICLKRLIEYETLNGNSRRAEHYRLQLAKAEGAL
jgi:serine/threonine protein kinase